MEKNIETRKPLVVQRPELQGQTDRERTRKTLETGRMTQQQITDTLKKMYGPDKKKKGK